MIPQAVWRRRVRVMEVAPRHGLDSDIVLAVVATESSGRTFAWNPEPHYRWLWDVNARAPFRSLTKEESESERPPADFPHPVGVDRDAEWWGQQASWGLMQVMGSVARERGFDGVDLPELCDPDLGLEYGCRQLEYLVNRGFTGDDMLATYNGGPGAAGGNRRYVDEVMRRHQEITGGRGEKKTKE